MNKRVTRSAFKRRFLALLPVGVVSIVVACGGMPQVDTQRDPPSTMSVRYARVQLVSSLGGLYGRTNLREVKFTRTRVTFTTDRDAGSADGGFGDPTETQTLTFASYTKLSFSKGCGGCRPQYDEVASDGSHRKSFEPGPYAAAFVEAVNVLRDAASSNTEPADFAAFRVAANAWLVTTPKPVMSEEARTYRLLAEDAIKRKDFSAALDAYTKALDRYPMWPEGQYNAAKLAAEAEDYEVAANHMRRYLVLAPEAKDARAAGDDLLVWQHKAKQ